MRSLKLTLAGVLAIAALVMAELQIRRLAHGESAIELVVLRPASHFSP
jgi:hypothetical protein